MLLLTDGLASQSNLSESSWRQRTTADCVWLSQNVLPVLRRRPLWRVRSLRLSPFTSERELWCLCGALGSTLEQLSLAGCRGNTDRRKIIEFRSRPL